MNNPSISIAIDGPSGAGKSTLAKAAAERFGFIYVDTGAIYRTVGLAAKKSGLGSRDEKGVAAMLPALNIELRHDDTGAQRMYLWNEDVSDQLRSPDISIYASDVSAMPAVRAYLLELQRGFAKKSGVVMDGRDIGTVVLPDAPLKIFLTALAEKRAERRYLELIAKGESVTLDEVLRDIIYRDANDSSRETAPLKPAEDSILLDTTELDLERSKIALFAIISEKFGI